MSEALKPASFGQFFTWPLGKHKNDDFDATDAKRDRVPKKWKRIVQRKKSTPEGITQQPNQSLPLDRYDLGTGTKLCLVFNQEEFQERKLISPFSAL